MIEPSPNALDVLTRYYLALDAFADLDLVRSFFTEDAVWSCASSGSETPELVFDPIDRFREMAEREGALARAARIRHHVTGLSTAPGPGGVPRSCVKVLVTAQPDPARPPFVKETALVSCDWRRDGDDWKIARLAIVRDSTD